MLQFVVQRRQVLENLLGVRVRKETDHHLSQRVQVIESNRLDRNKVRNVFDGHARLNHLLEKIPLTHLETLATKSF